MSYPIRPVAPPTDRTVPPVALPPLTPREREQEKERRERRRKARKPAPRTPDGRLDIRA